MSDKKIINLGYFDIDNKKNSIIENAPFQDNEITNDLNKIEKLSKKIKISLLKNNKKDNINNTLDFKSKK